jgi:hypothetical protein
LILGLSILSCKNVHWEKYERGGPLKHKKQLFVQLDVNILKLLKKCRKRRFMRWEHCEVCSRELKKEETSNHVNDTGLRSQKQNLRADYLINANNWKRILNVLACTKVYPKIHLSITVIAFLDGGLNYFFHRTPDFFAGSWRNCSLQHLYHK